MRARPRIPGATVKVTRRVANREARLRPSALVTRLIGYPLAITSNHYGLQIHAVCALPNHYHLLATDPRGELSNFSRDFHAVVAKLIIHAFKEDDETLWSNKQTNEVTSVEPIDTLGEVAYVMGNPVKHGMVTEGRSYPGLRRCWPQKPKTFERPRGFFRAIDWTPEMRTQSGRPKINWAETATLVMVRPPGFEHLADHELAEALRAQMQRFEDEARVARIAEGKGFMHRRDLRRMDRRSRSAPQETGQRIPTIKCSNPKRRRERLEALRQWHREYQEALRTWRTDRDAVFPYGTNKMRWLHGVNVAPAPT